MHITSSELRQEHTPIRLFPETTFFILLSIKDINKYVNRREWIFVNINPTSGWIKAQAVPVSKEKTCFM